MGKQPPNHLIPNDLFLPDEYIISAVKQFGTPLYIYDSNSLVKRWGLLKEIFPNKVDICYSVKANPNKDIIKLIGGLGAFFEVASVGEFRTVLSTGIDPAKVLFIGPGKTQTELRYTIEQDIGSIVVESLREINQIDQITKKIQKRISILLRINPGHSKGSLSMGGATQFGMEPDLALQILKNRKEYSHIRIIGIHGYLGTGILDPENVFEHSKMILEVFDKLQKPLDYLFSIVDLGGGLGIPYFDNDPQPNWLILQNMLNELFAKYREENQYLKIFFEIGRFLVGPCGVFVAKVIDVKENFGKVFVILDGGTNVFRLDAHYGGFKIPPLKILSDISTSTSQPISICGPLCTSSDRLAVDVIIPKPELGDYIVFYLAGAYGLTANPGLFLSHGYPKEIMLEDNHLKLIRDNIPIFE